MKKNITDEDQIVNHFNTYFTEIGPKLARRIQASLLKLCKFYRKLQHTSRSIFSLKINKSPGYDAISFNVVRNCFRSLLKPLIGFCNLSLQ